ncbi:FAD-dependent oxidoreductase [Comamonas testosteroni]|uniref:flavin monoamine oxidase family protein n=1 Tax=Comamonas testosteroni TaxID=285 RepID=UPI0026EA1C9B|nr:FAD-dependent oxidoreductase [Comamonas testosteroni]
MRAESIAIVGAGLSGVYAAYLLEQAGVSDYYLLEASTILGGRIRSVKGSLATNDQDRFDLGAAWYWPQMQPALDALVKSLELRLSHQYEQGSMMVERSPDVAPTRYPSDTNAPSSMRIEGGMLALVQAICKYIPTERRHLGQRVVAIDINDDAIALKAETISGEYLYWQASQVLLALPPRLAATSIHFSPELPANVHSEWQGTATWMASHAKYLAAYPTPFWREDALSGEARSYSGPMGEIHDASLSSGAGALFGFIGIPAHSRKRISQEALLRLCRAQLVRLFGPQAARPSGEWLVDWSQSSLTATAEDEFSSEVHLNAPAASVDIAPWNHRLIGIASEWSRTYPGYIAGAIEAAQSGVYSLLNKKQQLLS